MIDETKTLTVAMRKQIFKKKNRKEVQKTIRGLRMQSLKLKKKDLDQKAAKKKIAHQIKELTATLNNGGTD